MSRPLLLLFLGAALAAAPTLTAQSVHWDPPGGTLSVGEVSSLQLVFDDCSPDEAPAPPRVDGLRMDYQGQSSNISIINGSFSRNVTVSFSVLLSKQQDVYLPEFTVKTNKGVLHVPAAHYAPAGATVGSSGVSLGDAAQARLQPPTSSVWAGEVFDLGYSIDVAEGYYPSWGLGTFEWDPTPLITEDWSQPEPFSGHAAGARSGLAYHTRAIAPSAGHLRLNPTSQLVNLSVGVSGFGFFQQRQYQRFAVPSSPASLEVSPLPPAPLGFSGAVGSFSISSKIVPREVKEGEPITWTVELSGSGNWPEIHSLPSREAPREFQTIQPKPKRSQPQGKLFEGSLSEDVVLVPTQAGTYELPPLDFIYFDPKSGTYKTLTAPGATVTADPAGAAASENAEQSAAPGAPKVTAVSPTTEAKPPELPTEALGSPLDRQGSAPAPLRRRSLALAAAAPFALLALFWTALALKRAKHTDPLKAKRDARERLALILGRLAAAPIGEQSALLIAWQRDAALLWGVEHAAPPATAIGDASWQKLWEEADRFLYSPDPKLAPDWVGRAREALTRKPLKPFSPFSLLLGRNLLPFLIVAVGLILPASAAASPTAYQSGDFAQAEKAWRAQLNENPRDWAARHNLSLALSQQDRWGEATAHAAAAFVERPGDPATRRQLILSSEKAGFIPDPLDILLRPGPLEALARLASPGGWQRIAIAAAALLALAMALFLAGSYGVLRRLWAVRLSLTLALTALLTLGASWVGYRAYGLTADTRVVVVWGATVLRSIPTEADVTQKTTALPAGSTALSEKSFLDWIRISFPNGQSGWVLRREVIFLWQEPGD